MTTSLARACSNVGLLLSLCTRPPADGLFYDPGFAMEFGIWCVRLY